ncbi:MAG: Crp/Fnr family transcriptional regulator, partial [Bacteroidales bacterium]|nr:Crp/Fnr family transcriptional regulator [Bacteroidales bacterium]
LCIHYDLPSRDVIEALTDSSVIVIHKTVLSELRKKNPVVENFVNFMLSSYIETLVNRALEFKTLTAEEIYLRLLKRQPKELSNVPLKHLASYLGISPERLSRIRKKHENLT